MIKWNINPSLTHTLDNTTHVKGWTLSIYSSLKKKKGNKQSKNQKHSLTKRKTLFMKKILEKMDEAIVHFHWSELNIRSIYFTYKEVYILLNRKCTIYPRRISPEDWLTLMTGGFFIFPFILLICSLTTGDDGIFNFGICPLKLSSMWLRMDTLFVPEYLKGSLG